MTLVFGCRSADTDHLYKEEVLELKRRGVFRNVCTAYSHQPSQAKVSSSWADIVLFLLDVCRICQWFVPTEFVPVLLYFWEVCWWTPFGIHFIYSKNMHILLIFVNMNWGTKYTLFVLQVNLQDLQLPWKMYMFDTWAVYVGVCPGHFEGRFGRGGGAGSSSAGWAPLCLWEHEHGTGCHSHHRRHSSSQTWYQCATGLTIPLRNQGEQLPLSF